jgi:hypothetical protein
MGEIMGCETSPTKKALKNQGFLQFGGERGIRTLDKAFDPILP